MTLSKCLDNLEAQAGSGRDTHFIFVDPDPPSRFQSRAAAEAWIEDLPDDDYVILVTYSEEDP